MAITLNNASYNKRKQTQTSVPAVSGTNPYSLIGSSGTSSTTPGGSGISTVGYTPLDSSGNDYAGMTGMSDIDRAALDAAKLSWDRANAAGDQRGMDAAHQQAEALRRKYGYSGGLDGSQYIPENRFSYETAPEFTDKYRDQLEALAQQVLDSSRDPFTYDGVAPTYNNRYDPEIQALKDQILNRDPFSYDYRTDPQYQAYAKEYAREGQRAAANAMGQYAAMTGGMPSTAAMAASQQAGDYYSAQMADKIPELYQAAYSMYVDEGNNMRSNLSMLQGLEQGDYNKYLTELGQYNTDRDFALNAWNSQQNNQMNAFGMLKGLSDSDYDRYLAQLQQYNADRDFAYGNWSDQRAYDYQLGRDQVEDSRYDQEWQHQLDREGIEDQRYDTEWQHQLDREGIEDQRYDTEWQHQLDREGVSDSQWQQQFDTQNAQWQKQFDEDVRQFNAQYALQQAAAARAASSGGGGGSSRRSSGSSGSSSGNSGTSGGNYSLFDAAKSSRNPQNYISTHYKEYGFKSSSGLWAEYQEWAKNDYGNLGYSEDEGIFTWNGKTYKNLSSLQNALNSANMTPAEEEKLRRALDLYGFNS